MSITKQEVKEFFVNLEQEAEEDFEKAIAAAGLFLRSTYEALAHDPAVLAAIQGGFATAAATIFSAVETGGASLLPALCLAEAKTLVVNAGLAAEHALVPIVAGELHAYLAAPTAATPEHVNQ